MPNKTLTLSIVIPVYNEQDYLAACLDSIAAQAVKPLEVIIVDNNSTDNTLKIAESYSFVTVLHEKRQHQSFAQQTGFNAARGEVIGRIDADTILPADWTKKVAAYFAKNSDVIGITGSTQPYDISIGAAGTSVFKFYIDLASRIAGNRMLWGANCAVRRSAWQKISTQVMTRGDIWEDYDLSFCLAPRGQLQFVDFMDVDSSFRAVQQPMIKQTRYQFRAVRTFYHHRSLATTALFMSVWGTMYLMFLGVLLDRYILKPVFSLVNSSKQTAKKAAEVVQLKAE